MRVTELDEMKLIGLRVVCPGDQYVVEIPNASLRLIERLEEIHHLITPIRSVGAYVVGDYSEEEDGYWVCVEVSEHTRIPEGMVALTVPPQEYAVIRHVGPNTGIWQTYEVLHKWMEKQGYGRNLRAWHLEISDYMGNSRPEELVVELYDTIG